MYLNRIAAYDQTGPHINAYLHLNDHALDVARDLDSARHPSIAPSPIDGVPVILKDNIDTFDMPTTAGSVALTGSIPPDDAFIARKLREAGTIVMGKGTLTEFANFLTNGMPTGYSSLGGFGFNPYDRASIREPLRRSTTVGRSGRPADPARVRALSEPRLIALAYAFEQATQHRLLPASTPALPTDTVTRPVPQR